MSNKIKAKNKAGRANKRGEVRKQVRTWQTRSMLSQGDGGYRRKPKQKKMKPNAYQDRKQKRKRMQPTRDDFADLGSLFS